MGYTPFAGGRPHQGVTREDMRAMVPIIDAAITQGLALRKLEARQQWLRELVYNGSQAQMHLTVELIIERLAGAPPIDQPPAPAIVLLAPAEERAA